MARQFEKDEEYKTHISALPTEIITLVFNHLPNFERLCTIPAVCQHWQDITKTNLCRYNSVAFVGREINVPINYTFCKVFREPYECRQIITIAGWVLHSIIFHEHFQIPENVLELIGQHCPQLRHLETPNNMSTEDIATLSKNCSQLERLVMRNIPHNCDAEMSMLFKANPKLSKFTLTSCNFSINHNCLSFLAEGSCQFDLIKFMHCTINRAHLEVFEKLQVREIVFQDTPAYTALISPGDKSLVKCAGEIGDYLHYFSMSRQGWSPTLWPMRHFTAICNLTGLVSLHIENIIWLCDKHIVIITENCRKLRAVKLVICRRVKDTGMGHLLRLPELRVLCFGNYEPHYMYKFDHGLPSLLPKLMQLRLSDITVSENGLLNVVKFAPRLRLLELIGCFSIDTTIVEKVKLTRIDSRCENDDLLTLCLNRENYNRIIVDPANRCVVDHNLTLLSHRDQIRRFLKEILDDMFSDIEKNRRPSFPDFFSSLYTLGRCEIIGREMEYYLGNLPISDFNDLKPID